MQGIFSSISDQIWSTDIWLPPNITWHHYEGRQDYAQFYPLLLPIPMALVMVVVRIVLDRVVFRPVGRVLGISDRHRRMPDHNPLLETAFLHGSVDYDRLSSQTGLSDR